MERASTIAWWLEEGSEECPFCLQSYHYEVEVRCVDCDRPMCPQCTVRVRVRHEVHCPDCEPAEGG